MPRRKRQTIAGAIAYVSEVDFPGQTREVSKRLGIIQPQQYHCFADKQSKVECTHQSALMAKLEQASSMDAPSMRRSCRPPCAPQCGNLHPFAVRSGVRRSPAPHAKV